MDNTLRILQHSQQHFNNRIICSKLNFFSGVKEVGLVFTEEKLIIKKVTGMFGGKVAAIRKIGAQFLMNLQNRSHWGNLSRTKKATKIN